MIRLNKHIASLGFSSRRKADELIISGKIKVNGSIIKNLGNKVCPETDIIHIEDVSQKTNQIMVDYKKDNKLYIMLNKPIDYISSTTNAQGISVLDLITPLNYHKQAHKDEARNTTNVRLYPVGRLDKDSEGLILLTNDGELTNQLTHPRHQHEKEYEITTDRQLTPDAKKILAKGMIIGEERYGGMKIKKEFNKGRRVIITVVLKEGKNRHIRKMFGKLGYNIYVLRRIRIEKLTLGILPIGKWKFVKKTEIL